MSELDRMEKQFEAELKMIQTLYQETGKNASKALEDVQKLNEETTKNAREVLEDIKMANRALKSSLKKVAFVIGTVASVVLTILTFFGVEKYQDLVGLVKRAENAAIAAEGNAKESESSAKRSTDSSMKVDTFYAEAKKQLGTILHITNEAKSLRFIMLDIKKIASECGLNQEIDLEDEKQLFDLYLAHIFVENELYKRYIINYEKFDYDVVFEAVATYIEIAKNAELVLSPEKIPILKNAILYILQKAGEESSETWNMQIESRQMYVNLCNMEKEQPTFVPGNIRIDLGMDFTMSPGNLGLRWNIALIMAELGIQNDMAMDFLRELIKIEQENPWRVSLSCIALIKLRQNDSWGIISEQFNKGNGYFAFAAALLLGQLGKKELEDLGIENLSIGYTTDKIAEIKKILERNLNKSSNKYAKQYIKKIIKKLNIEMPSS